MDRDFFGYEPNPGNEMPAIATYSAKELYNIVAKKFIDFKEHCSSDILTFYVSDNIGYEKGSQRRYDQKDFSTYAKFKAELGLTKRGKYAIGFHKDLFRKTVALELVLSDEAIKENRWDDVTRIAKQLGQTVVNRRNLDLTHMAVTFAASTSYIDQDGQVIDTTTGDGLSLANAAHLLAHSASTYSNIAPASQFSKAGLMIAKRQARNNTMDNFGVPKEYKWSHIWSTEDEFNVEEILQFLKSTSDPVQANSNVENYYKNRYKAIFLPEIDTTVDGLRDTAKSRYWGIGAFEGNVLSGDRASLVYGEWEAPHMKPFNQSAMDFSRDAVKYAARGRYGACAIDGMGIIFNFAPFS